MPDYRDCVTEACKQISLPTFDVIQRGAAIWVQCDRVSQDLHTLLFRLNVTDRGFVCSHVLPPLFHCLLRALCRMDTRNKHCILHGKAFKETPRTSSFAPGKRKRERLTSLTWGRRGKSAAAAAVTTAAAAAATFRGGGATVMDPLEMKERAQS